MNRLAICTLYAFVVAAILRPSVIQADEEGATGGDPQPIFIPQLANPVPVNFDETQLIDVVEYFQNTVDITIDVDWQELEKWNVPKKAPINLRFFADIPSGRAIELMLVSAAGDRLALLLDDGKGLHVTMKRKAAHLIKTDPRRWAYWHAAPSLREEGDLSPKEEAIAKIGEAIPWNFERNRIRNIFEYLRNVSHPNIFVDWVALKRVGVVNGTLVTAKDKPTAASEVLDTVLATTGNDLAWRIDDFGIVIISTRDVIDEIFPATGEADGAEAGRDE